LRIRIDELTKSQHNSFSTLTCKATARQEESVRIEVTISKLVLSTCVDIPKVDNCPEEDEIIDPMLDAEDDFSLVSTRSKMDKKSVDEEGSYDRIWQDFLAKELTQQSTMTTTKCLLQIMKTTTCLRRLMLIPNFSVVSLVKYKILKKKKKKSFLLILNHTSFLRYYM
jgi:hypothetical protein